MYIDCPIIVFTISIPADFLPSKLLEYWRPARNPPKNIVSHVGFRKGYGSYHELLDDPEVDIVNIVTPNYLHIDQIIGALRAGKHVLCEKPLALNSDETEEILVEARNSDCRLGMVFNYRLRQ